MILDIVKMSIQIAIWEGSLYPYVSTLREGLLVKEGVGIQL